MLAAIRRRLLAIDLEIYLASGSPRRRDILNNVGFEFHVKPSSFPEDLDKTKFSHPTEYAIENAKRKAEDVSQQIEKGLVIGADTIVVLGNQILEKPKTPEVAMEMLKCLNGCTHKVITGVALIFKQKKDATAKLKTFHVTSDVMFSQMELEFIQDYVDSGEPLDKAGGYGIQGLGGTLVECIHGDFYSVEGLPLHALCREILNILQTTA